MPSRNCIPSIPLPHLTPNGETSKDYLWTILIHRLREWELNDKTYFNRLKHEYKIITDMGFEDYFLV